jgi:methyltransferase (TIGR00027 family)
MEAGKASRSAMGSGLLRAAHVREDRPPWILQDTLAARLLNATETQELDKEMATWTPEVRQAFRLSHAVRARLAEDVAIDGLAAGRRDYVLLGAGLDTFAWRHPRAGEFTVWEVDHPSTQAWKRAALRRPGIVAVAEPAHVRFVPADLATAAVRDLGLPDLATWNWLGVTMYLEPAATQAVLRAIAAASHGTTLVVNFLLAAGPLDALARSVRDASAAAVAAAGEPVVATYTRDQAEDLLRTAGFSRIEMFDATALRARYLPGRADLRLPGSTVIAVATV